MNKITEKIKFEFSSVKKDVTVIEIIFWWITRICLIVGLCTNLDSQSKVIVLVANTIGSFGFSLLRLLCPKDSFICRTTYRVQTLTNFHAFTGCFLLHCTDFYDWIHVDKHDFWLHLISGVTIFLIGYYMTVAIDKNKTANPTMLTIGATGFSFTAMVAWEIMEFVSDFILGSNNQNYKWNPEDNAVLGNLLSKTAAGPEHYVVMDTMIDMMLAAIMTAISAIILFIYLKNKEKKNKK